MAVECAVSPENPGDEVASSDSILCMSSDSGPERRFAGGSGLLEPELESESCLCMAGGGKDAIPGSRTPSRS